MIEWSWVRGNLGLLGTALGQHAELSGIAVALGLLISLPLSVLAWRFHALRTPIFTGTGLLYTIPSIALFVLVQPITGYFSLTSAEVALVGYTLLILVRNTVAGLDAIPEEIRESAQAIGYTFPSQLVRVYLPLSLPSMFAGLRVATVTVVGLVTVTAFIGQGGLGQVIINGFTEAFATPIIVALVLSIALAAAGDAFFVFLERVTLRWSRTRR